MDIPKTQQRYLNQSTLQRLAPRPNAFILLLKPTTELETGKYDEVGKVQSVQEQYGTCVQRQQGAIHPPIEIGG